jgi:RimJ/RimL family protein N-acetyltransferase
MIPILAQGKDIQALDDLTIRPAMLDDVFLLWEWANEPVTRVNSFNTEFISWNAHQSWYTKKLLSSDSRFWILELKRTPAGQIRYDRVSVDTAQISFSVAACFRGKGLGTFLLEKTSPMAARELAVKCVRGVALSHNQSSHRTFIKAGFTVTERQLIANRECVVFSAAFESDRR